MFLLFYYNLLARSGAAKPPPSRSCHAPPRPHDGTDVRVLYILMIGWKRLDSPPSMVKRGQWQTTYSMNLVVFVLQLESG